MAGSLPALSGNQLIDILVKDGWQIARKSNHGASLWKKFGNRKRVTVIPTGNKSLPQGTLSAILGPQQTGIGRNGLASLLRIDRKKKDGKKRISQNKRKKMPAP